MGLIYQQRFKGGILRIISHRGYWKAPEEKNTVAAFNASFALSRGTETDFRDFNQRLVISHDPPTDGCLAADWVLSEFSGLPEDALLAINIKADGLQTMLSMALAEHEIKNYFLFDMSIPDMIQSIKQNLTCFSRQSEYEPVPALYEQCPGVWLDGFSGEWYDEKTVETHLKNGKTVCVVSPELHKRDPKPLWERLASWKVRDSHDLVLCTDLLENAIGYFES